MLLYTWLFFLTAFVSVAQGLYTSKNEHDWIIEHCHVGMSSFDGHWSVDINYWLQYISQVNDYRGGSTYYFVEGQNNSIKP